MTPEVRETDPDATYKRLEEMARRVLAVPKERVTKKPAAQS